MIPQLRIYERSVLWPWRAVFVAMCAMPLAGPGAAQALAQSEQIHKLTDDDAPRDSFGNAGSISGGTAVLGAVWADGDASSDSGGWIEQQQLTASDAGFLDAYSSAVSLNGNVLVVGAGLNDTAGTDAGAAYVYRFDGTRWVEEQKLIASDPGVFQDLFGRSVSVSGDVLVVGAHLNDTAGTDAGAAYVYRYDGENWVQEQQLFASDIAPGDLFGFSVSVDGDVLIVGADWNDAAGEDAGAAYVYRYNATSWVEEQQLTSLTPGFRNSFGGSVSVNGNVLIVGESSSDAAGSAAGAAYVYRYDGNNWVEEQQLIASDATAFDSFGKSVFLDGDVVVVGAFLNDTAAGANAGAAYVFRYNGASWVEQQQLTASDAIAQDLFGASVAVSGGSLVVGAWRSDTAEDNAGAAYVYRYDGNNWVEEHQLIASDAGPEDNFGWSVALRGDMLVVGALFADAAGADTGAVYIFEFQPTDFCIDEDGDGMVTICHIPPGNPDNARTITVGVNAVPAHLAHGDLCGPCQEDDGLLLGDSSDGHQDECSTDLDDSGDVGAADLAELLGAWGLNPGHPADLDGDGNVGPLDLATVLGTWGPCL